MTMVIISCFKFVIYFLSGHFREVFFIRRDDDYPSLFVKNENKNDFLSSNHNVYILS